MRKQATIAWLVLFLFVTASVGFAEAPEATTPPEAAAPETTARPYGEPMDGNIRVQLQSLAGKTALGMTLDGAYAVDGDRGFQFEPGTEIALGLSGGHVVLKAGGLTIDMGGGFTLTRHLDADGNAGGVYIHESEKDTLYAGDIEISARNDALRVVVTLNIEDYLYGVVPYEMSDTFPIEALKAQAVAARTYAMQRKARNARDEFDVVDTANDQVYKGLDDRFDKPIQAVDETRGIVGMYDDSIAECFYSASNGGQTALASDVWGNGDFGYLDIRDDPYDLANPESVVKSATLTGAISDIPEALRSALHAALLAKLTDNGTMEKEEELILTKLTGVEAVDPVYGGESRQYGTVRFTLGVSVRGLMGEETNAFRMYGEEEPLDEAQTVDLSFYEVVRQALGIGINSSTYDMLTVQPTDEGGFKLITRRYGHGVGLSQRGAQVMAGEHGMGYLEILAFYYPGLEMVQMEWADPGLTPADALPESLGYAAPRPTPAPTAGPLPPLQEGEYYATVQVEGVDSTLNVREGPTSDDRILGKIRGGARLIVQEELEDGWAKMKTAELEGYVMMSFIVKEE